jgi:hypothetical protein
VSGTSLPAVSLWRCFPWNAGAKPGEPFSPEYLQSGQTAGRFDLQDRPPVRYLAGTAEHAVGEILQGFRGATLTPAHLKRHGWPLALVEVTAPGTVMSRVANLDDPSVLLSFGLRPGELAHHDRAVTQAVARQVHAAGHAGLRWWSALTGAWASTVLFTDAVPRKDLTFGASELLTLKSPAVVEAARLLGIAVP